MATTATDAQEPSVAVLDTLGMAKCAERVHELSNTADPTVR